MNAPYNPLITKKGFDCFIEKKTICDNLQFADDKEKKKRVSKIIQIPNKGVTKYNSENISMNGKDAQTIKKSNFSLHSNTEAEVQQTTFANSGTLFRLFVKNGEYIYARPSDIIMIESCDHLVKVYLGIVGKVKLTIRHGTLKDFLSQLPQCQFMRINRFYAINVLRLSGGNSNGQIFEFDFEVSIKLKHFISHSVFRSIGK